VFLGGKASGFRNLRDHDTYDADGTRLFQVCVNELLVLVLLSYKHWISKIPRQIRAGDSFLIGCFSHSI
jgi:hypothetical protein